MSLASRISLAVKHRDWSAAVVDIGVVAIGILMALAVDRWQSERSIAAREVLLLQKTHDEIIVLEPRVSSLSESMHTNLVRFGNVRNHVLTEDQDSLSTADCEALLYYRLAPTEYSFSTLEQLQNPETLRTSRYASVRAAARALLDNQKFQADFEKLLYARTVDLVVGFPNLLPVHLRPANDPNDIDGYVPTTTCQLHDMRGNRAFMNALHRDYTVMLGVTSSYDEVIVASLNRLHIAIDSALGVQHVFPQG